MRFAMKIDGLAGAACRADRVHGRDLG